MIVQEEETFLCSLQPSFNPRGANEQFSPLHTFFSLFRFSREAEFVNIPVYLNVSPIPGKSGTCVLRKMFKLTKANIAWLLVSIVAVVHPSASMLLEQLSPGKLLAFFMLCTDEGVAICFVD